MDDLDVIPIDGQVATHQEELPAAVQGTFSAMLTEFAGSR